MSHDDFNFEPVRGLPGKLPEGEHILWQGSPSVARLAREALAVRWIGGYFALLALWRVGVSSTEYPMPVAIAHAVPFVLAGAVVVGIVYLIAWAQARATVYTLTNRRVAMRIGAALSMTLNLPYVCIGTAKFLENRDGTGTLAFELLGETRLSYLMTWPHVRPYVFARTQPALRCIPDARTVAGLFAEAAETRISAPQVSRAAPAGGHTLAAE